MTPRWVVLGGLALVAGCSFLKPHADPTRFYVLSVEGQATRTAPVAVVVGVDRVTLADYLVRPELVTREASNQLSFAEYDQWGESIKDAVPRTLRGDLALRLGEGRVLEPPFDPARRPDLIVDVEVRRFERVADGGVVLDAGWTIRDGRTGATLLHRTSHLHHPTAGSTSAAAVAALSQSLAALSDEIATAVRQRR